MSAAFERRDVPQAVIRRTPGRHNNGGDRCMRAYSITENPYTDEEVEALKAVDEYKLGTRTGHPRPFPHLTELLDVLRSIGWEKVQK